MATAFNWRAIFVILAIYVGLSCLSFIFFRETYRKERSLVYQNALKSRLKHRQVAGTQSSSESTASPFTAHGANTLGELPIVDEANGIDEHKTEKGGENVYEPDYSQVKVSLKDASPFKHTWHCLRRLNNLTILLASGKFQTSACLGTFANNIQVCPTPIVTWLHIQRPACSHSVMVTML
jgi:hypothetical protein